MFLAPQGALGGLAFELKAFELIAFECVAVGTSICGGFHCQAFIFAFQLFAAVYGDLEYYRQVE